MSSLECPECHSSAGVTFHEPDLASHPTGEELHRSAGYEIMEEIGRGGMGVVYRARQVTLDRLVALKTIEVGPETSVHARHRFVAEGRTLAGLQHPNIIQIHEVGETPDGLPFLAMELVEGGSLNEMIGRLPFPPEAAARVALVLTRAVHAAHQRGIVHRDLKPENVLLALLTPTTWPTREARRAAFLAALDDEQDTDPFLIKLSDFGLALDIADARLGKGGGAGTPSYMAPEQFVGDEVGPRADVYSLGVILYEMLAGRPPFVAASPQAIFHQVAFHDPVAPSALGIDVPADLENICMKCLHKRPSWRYASAAALADDLARFLDGEPVRARPVGPWERVRKWSRRQPALAALSLASLLGVFVFLAVLIGLNWQLRGERDNARQLEQRAQQEQQRAEAEARAARRQADRSRRALYTLQLLRVAGLAEQEPARALELLTDTRTCPLDLRDIAWTYWFERCQAKRALVVDVDIAASALGFDENGRLLAAAVSGGQIVFRDAVTDQQIASSALSETPTCIVFAAAGRLAAVGVQSGSVLIFDVKSGGLQKRLKAHAAPVRAVRFAPDGLTLATGGDDKTARIWDIASGEERAVLRGHAASVLALAFTPDGARLVTGGADAAVLLWDAATAKRLRSLQGHQGPVICLNVSADGGRLVSGELRVGEAAAGEIRLWSLDDDESVVVMPGHAGGVSAVLFTSDGRTVISSGGDGLVKFWDPTLGQERGSLPSFSGPVRLLACSGDGRTIAAAASTPLRIWRLAAAPLLAVLHGHSGPVLCLDFSADGKRLASGSADHTVKLWDLRRGQEEATLAHHEAPVNALAFSAAGLLASGDERGNLVLWDADTLEVSATLKGPASSIRDLDFAPDGKALAAAYRDGSVLIWDIASKSSRTLAHVPQAAAQAVAFSPDGKVVRAGFELANRAGEIRGWTLGDDAPTPTWPTRSGVLSLAFSPTGATLASSHQDWSLGLRAATTGKVKFEARASRWPTFLGAGEALAAASFDHGIRRLDADTGKDLGLLPVKHGHVIAALARSVDGKLLASAGWDQTIRLWGPPR